MLSSEKVKLMTRAAIYEKKERKRNLRINRFRQEDYIAWNVIKSLLGITVGYALIVVVYVLYGSEALVDQLTLEFLYALGKRFLWGYVAALVAAGLVSYAVYYVKYQRARKENRAYVQYLKKINHIYQKENGPAGDAREDLP